MYCYICYYIIPKFQLCLKRVVEKAWSNKLVIAKFGILTVALMQVHRNVITCLLAKNFLNFLVSLTL